MEVSRITGSLARRGQIKHVRVRLLHDNVYPLHVGAPATLGNRQLVFVALVVDVRTLGVKVPQRALHIGERVHIATGVGGIELDEPVGLRDGNAGPAQATHSSAGHVEVDVVVLEHSTAVDTLRQLLALNVVVLS